MQTPCAVVDCDGEMVPTGFPDPGEVFLELDTKLMGLMETIGGVYLPQNITDPANKDSTATAAALTAQRENEIRQGNLSRQQNQFADMMTGMQRSFCHAENIKAAKLIFDARQKGGGYIDEEAAEFAKDLGDPLMDSQLMPETPEWVDDEAVEAIVEMMQRGLSPLEIYMLGRSSAADPLGDSQKLGNVMAIYGNDTTANTRPIKKKHVTMLAGAETADTLYPDNPAIEQDGIAAARQQAQETATILANFPGTAVPVLNSDNHLVHFDSGMATVDGLAEGFTKTNVFPPDEMIDGIINLGVHLEGHLQAAIAQGANPKDELMQQRVLKLDNFKTSAQGLKAAAAHEQSLVAAGGLANSELPTPLASTTPVSSGPAPAMPPATGSTTTATAGPPAPPSAPVAPPPPPPTASANSAPAPGAPPIAGLPPPPPILP